MAINTAKSIDGLAIRDTSSHTGSVIFNGDFTIKTIIIENGLDQIVTLQCEASANGDFSNSFNVGSTFDVSVTSNTYQTCTSYFPYWRISAQCSSSPSTGSLTVWAMGVK